MQPPHDLLDFLQRYSTYLLISHAEPDGDCLSSSLALGRILESRDKQVRHFNPGPFIRSEIRSFEPFFTQDPKALAAPGTGECGSQACGVVVLDCSTAERIGDFAGRIEEHPVAVIDHHAAREDFGDVTYIDSRAASTSYLILQVAHSLGYELDGETADHILFGLCTDTGYFRHLDTGAGPALRAAAELAEAGASPMDAFDRMFGGKTFASRQLNARLLSRAQPIMQGAGYITWETADDTAEFGRDNRDSDTLYQLLLGTKGTRLVALLREEPEDGCSGSLRSNDDTDVAAIAKAFGGGGHTRAAGFDVEQSLERTKERLLPYLESALAGTRVQT